VVDVARHEDFDHSRRLVFWVHAPRLRAESTSEMPRNAVSSLKSAIRLAILEAASSE
jgi:hypothetical protein